MSVWLYPLNFDITLCTQKLDFWKIRRHQMTVSEIFVVTFLLLLHKIPHINGSYMVYINLLVTNIRVHGNTTSEIVGRQIWK